MRGTAISTGSAWGSAAVQVHVPLHGQTLPQPSPAQQQPPGRTPPLGLLVCLCGQVVDAPGAPVAQLYQRLLSHALTGILVEQQHLPHAPVGKAKDLKRGQGQ